VKKKRIIIKNTKLIKERDDIMDDINLKDYYLIMGYLIEKSVQIDTKIKESEYCCIQELDSLKRELKKVNKTADKISQIINKKECKKMNKVYYYNLHGFEESTMLCSNNKYTQKEFDKMCKEAPMKEYYKEEYAYDSLKIEKYLKEYYGFFEPKIEANFFVDQDLGEKEETSGLFYENKQEGESSGLFPNEQYIRD